MIFNIFSKLFSSKNERILNKYSKILFEINSLEKSIVRLSDSDLKLKFLNLKSNVKDFHDLDKILPLTFAIVREVSKRCLGMRHFDVQILSGIALYQKKIIEVATGEGKTLVATLPACLYSILDKPIHIVTVNDYLSKRDSNWMNPIYNFLNISCGTILPDMSINKKQNLYKNNIVYGTSSEFGFDYLRDNIIMSSSEKVQSDLFYVIIDEVDSVLIDEARTPLIISEPEKIDSEFINLISKLIKKLILCDSNSTNGHYFLDEKIKNVYFTENGFLYLEKLLQNNGLLKLSESLYNFSNLELLHYIYAALKAQHFFFRDIDYIIKDGSILIIDERTGRIMEGRRWGDGIHQAIEAKEFLPIKGENPTLASITFQNYFRLYDHICGMTGTAYTESLEFEEIYNLDVIVIPTNKKCLRYDYSDIIFLNKKYKFEAIIKDIISCYKIGRPVLVGTVSVSVSEFLSQMLSDKGIKHNVLNAKYHEKESQIIAEAGRFKSVTISTNMAGRGTDIVLGGKTLLDLEYENILKLGGLKIIGTERHESRRIDNQLRGRSGRQGDPGSSQFYLSLEDDLIRLFIGEKTRYLLKKLNFSENEAITHPLITKSIENAQKKVELYNFNIRKELLDFDNILNEQRKIIYKYRNFLIFSFDIKNFVFDILKDLTFILIDKCYKIDTYVYNTEDLFRILNLDFNFSFNTNFEFIDKISLINFIFNSFYEYYLSKKYSILKFLNFSLERKLLLNILDLKWKEYILDLDYLKNGIYLRSYASKDPKDEYKKESFNMFNSMLNVFKYDFISSFLKFSFNFNENFSNIDYKKLNIEHINFFNKTDLYEKSLNKTNYKIGRNDICFCGSYKKFKHCHGKNK